MKVYNHDIPNFVFLEEEYNKFNFLSGNAAAVKKYVLKKSEFR